MKGKLKGYAALLLALLLTAMTLLNIGAALLEKRTGARLDLSFNRITSYGEDTGAVLAALNHPVQIYAVYRKGEEDAPLLELLDRYAAATPYITWQQTDPSLNPALIQRFSTDSRTVTTDQLIVYGPDADRWRVLGAEDFVSLSMDEQGESYTAAGWTYEESLTRAIVYVTRETIPQVCIAQGHGELDREACSAFQSLLEANQYDVVYAEMTADGWSWDPGSLLVFFSPLRDLTEEELDRVAAFAAAGGSFLFACDYSDPLSEMQHYAALLRSYGILPMDGIVVADRDEPETYDQQVRIRLVPELLSTDLTMDLLAAGMNHLILPGARAFDEAEETDRNLIIQPVLRSGENAYLKQLTAQTTSMERTQEDPQGPFTLALEARRVTEEGYVSRAFAVGCSALLTENRLWTMTDSQPLILRVMEFLLQLDASGLHTMARDGLRPGLRGDSLTVGSIVVTALPAAVLAAALIVLVPRKRRRE